MATPAPKLRSHVDYTVACICPMGVELAPVEAMLDHIHPSIPTTREQNVYTLGDLAGHNVAIAAMPEVGNNAAATVITQLLNDFPSVRFGLLVGIGGAVPGVNSKHDIRLGDVVVGYPTDEFGGVVQYDLGKKVANGSFQRTGQLARLPSILRAYIQKLKAHHARLGSQIPSHLSEMLTRYPPMRKQYYIPTDEPDQLFLSSYTHQSGATCLQCDKTQTISRKPRHSDEPEIHYGTIGSANVVLKDPVVRDKLREDMNIICVEMEAAGLMTQDFPCLVIRGICDYADSHKSKKWQPYAAAVAAAYMKDLLMLIPAQGITKSNQSDKIMEIETPNVVAVPYHDQHDESSTHLTYNSMHMHDAQVISQARNRMELYQSDPKKLRAETTRSIILDSVDQDIPAVADFFMKPHYRSFQQFDYERAFQKLASIQYQDTCTWILRHPKYRLWAGSRGPCLMWLSGLAGAGKTTLLTHIVQDLEQSISEGYATKQVLLYSFYERSYNDSCSSMISVMIHQLLTTFPSLQSKAYALDGTTSNAPSSPRSSNQLWWLLQQLFQAASLEKIYLVFDGLNFLSEESLTQIFEGLDGCPSTLHCLMSGRGQYLPSFPQASRDLSTLKQWRIDLDQDVLADTNRDLDAYTSHQCFHSERSTMLFQSRKEDLYARLRSGYQFNFLDIYLYLETVFAMSSTSDFWSEVERLPVQKEALCRHLFRKLHNLSHGTTTIVLQHLLFGFKKFTLSELAYVCHKSLGLAVRTAEQEVEEAIKSCAPLISIRGSNKRIDFIHAYVRELLLSYLQGLPPGEHLSLVEPESHTILAQQCWWRLQSSIGFPFPEIWEKNYIARLADVLQSHIFLKYAFQNWYKHLQLASMKDAPSSGMLESLRTLIQDLGRLWSNHSKEAIMMRELMITYGGVPHLDSRVMMGSFELCCALGLTVFVQTILNQKLTSSAISRGNGRIEFALALSIKGGHRHTAKMLMGHYNITSLDDDAYKGIVEQAARHDEPELLRMLLKMRKRSPQEISKAHAVAFKTGNIRTLNVLREEKAFANRDQWGATVLHAEFRWGGAPTEPRNIRALVARIGLLVDLERVDIHAKEGMHGNSALHLACWYNYPKEVISALLLHGANPRALNTFRWTPLHLAARYASAECVGLLLRRGGRSLVNETTRGGNSPLHWVTESRDTDGGEDIMKLFLAAGADPRLENKRGETPLLLGGSRHLQLLTAAPAALGIEYDSEPDLELSLQDAAASSPHRYLRFESESELCSGNSDGERISIIGQVSGEEDWTNPPYHKENRRHKEESKSGKSKWALFSLSSLWK